jgi:cytochrome c peroxidase
LNSSLFWDGRETDVINFVARPIGNHVEMGMDDPEAVCDKLSKLPYYADLFKKAYGDETITFDRVSESIAMFMSAIQTKNSRFDHYTDGKAQLTALELQGMNLFHTKYNCATCHNVSAAYYGGDLFMSIGLDKNPKDKGRGGITYRGEDNGTFRIPTLRNVALTAPYMHDGRFKTLEHVLEHYSKGIQDDQNLAEQLRDAKHQPMKMNISEQETSALIAFLNTLTDHNMISDPKFSNPFKVN